MALIKGNKRAFVELKVRSKSYDTSNKTTLEGEAHTHIKMQEDTKTHKQKEKPAE
jgi:hypothetical protein